MNLFIVSILCREDETILGIFSTFELAKAEMNRFSSSNTDIYFKEIKRLSDTFWARHGESRSIYITKTKLDKGSK